MTRHNNGNPFNGTLCGRARSRKQQKRGLLVALTLAAKPDIFFIYRDVAIIS